MFRDFRNKSRHDGVAIALAWPETKCRQAGAWYDTLMKWAGVNKKGYYKVGHAAVVLISAQDGICHYFDFGRYHAPAGWGRVRDKETDHDLKIKLTAELSHNLKLLNYKEIYSEIQSNDSCHGTGVLHSAYCPVHFDRAFQTAVNIQDSSPHKYGPFVLSGTNCSRFVRTVILAGNPTPKMALPLSIPPTITPSPMTNIYALSNRFSNSPGEKL
ncbi:MAG: hypothetical protein IPM42_02150 [Saprospiraceae bacterium]|nr:hypothetical protein [Saprospiraceae bacterium]